MLLFDKKVMSDWKFWDDSINNNKYYKYYLLHKSVATYQN